MKAMILAAGKGTRVQPLTYEMPKPMIPILGKPVMEYLLEELASQGTREVMINISYLPEQIESYFRDGRRWGVEIGYSFEGHVENGEIQPHALGSAGGMKKIQSFGGFFDETFIVVCGDALIDIDLQAALKFHREKGAVASLIAKEVPIEEVSSYGVVVADAEGRISLFQEKPSVAEARSNLVNTGIYIFEPEVLDLIPDGVSYDIGSQLFPTLVERGLPFYAINLPFTWIDIGNMRDFWYAHQEVLNGHYPHIPMPGKEIRPGVWVGLNVSIDWDQAKITGPVYIGSGTRVEAGATIEGPSWIGNGCQILNGAHVSRSVIFEYTRIGTQAWLEDMVVCGVYGVDSQGRTVNLAEADLGWIIEDSRMPLDTKTRPQQGAGIAAR
jgi:mannose-1-phosphate guanylyltransferase